MKSKVFEKPWPDAMRLSAKETTSGRAIDVVLSNHTTGQSFVSQSGFSPNLRQSVQSVQSVVVSLRNLRNLRFSLAGAERVSLQVEQDFPFAPQVFQAVILAQFGGENVHHHRAKI